MGMIEVKQDFTKRELMWFGPLMMLFVGIIGGVAMARHEAHAFAYGLWAFAAVLIAIYYAIPKFQRSIYRGWIYAVMPIGWVISHVLLTVIYYGLLTPIGMLMRVCRYDPMYRAFDQAATTYWVARDTQRPKASYFKQY